MQEFFLRFVQTAGVLRDARDRLIQLGLETDLAATYLHLLVHGPGGASTLASALHASRAEVYRRLERLVEKGLVVATSGRPVVYRPSEPAMVFKVLHDQHAHRAEDSLAVQEEMSLLGDRFEALSSTATVGTTFRNLTGRAAVYAEIHRLLDIAGEEVLVVNTHPDAAALAEKAGLWDRMSELAELGVRVQVLMDDEAKLRQHVRQNLAGTLRALHPGDILRFMIVDRRHVLLGVENDGSSWMDSPLEKVVVTDAPGFLAAYLALFRHLWNEATDVREPLQANRLVGGERFGSTISQP